MHSERFKDCQFCAKFCYVLTFISWSLLQCQKMSLKKGIGAYLLMKNDANWQKLDNQSRLSKTAEEDSDGKARKLISWSKNMQRSNFWTTLLIRFEQGWRNRGMRGGGMPPRCWQINLGEGGRFCQPNYYSCPSQIFKKSQILGQFGFDRPSNLHLGQVF